MMRAAAAIIFSLLLTDAASAQTAIDPSWQFGALVDVAALLDPNDPANHEFRNRGTTSHVNELDVNVAAAYIRKDVSKHSRIGFEATVQTGKDVELYGFSAVAPNLGGADALRHLGPTDVTYLAPISSGLTIQGGIFTSLIGYDSLYAKDNFAYTRPWGADYTPYLMMGVNASYPISSRLTATAFVVNGYFHLAHANDAPSVGGQLSWRIDGGTTIKQTVLYGSHQAETALEFWRVLSDTILERKSNAATMAVEYQVGSERVATDGRPRALWMSAQAPLHWQANAAWALTVRPEFAWDRDGRWIGAPQSVAAVTGTIEYRLPTSIAAVVRAEYRIDSARDSGGGFFAGADDHLIATQDLFIVAAIVTFAARR